MNLLEVIFIVSGVVITLFALDIAKKQKFNALHFLVFISIGLGLLVFTFFPDILNQFGRIFGVQRGADVLVYVSIIFLMYFSILLLNKVEKNREDTTILIREQAIFTSPQKNMSGKICFLVRVYNEAPVIEQTLQSILQAKFKNIVVVDDGSTDGTKEILQEWKKKITLITHPINRGAGAALETGFEYLRRYGKVEYVCCFDADGQHQIEDIHHLITPLDADPELEIVLGSRFIKHTNTNIGFIRKIVLKLGIVFTFFVSQIRLTDSHNGYRVFRLSALNKIHLTIDDMSYASELVDIIARKKIKFVEMPVNIKYTPYSLQKGQSSGNAFNIALKTFWFKFFK